MAKKSKIPYLAAALLFAAGTGYMIFSGLSENSMYFINVAEALELPQEEPHSARVFGTVSEKELRMDTDGVDFLLLDADHPEQSVRVVYPNAVPENFKAGAEVIVEGSLQHKRFSAKVLMTKCPSKYQKENRV